MHATEREMPTIQSKGGVARAEKLSPDERKRIASDAARARWEKPEDVSESSILKAVCGGPERPLKIANVDLPCYVLEGGRRVIHQRGMVNALGMARGGSSRGGGDRLAHFVGQKTLEPFVSSELVAVTAAPLLFRTPRGALAYGYDATILADICEAILEARKEDKLSRQQEHIAKQAEVLIRAFAKVGIVALVDEATGYQEIREKDDLQRILSSYISESLLPWTERFPIDFFKEMFRVWGWPWPDTATPYKGPIGPRYAGKIIKQVIYGNLPPGVLEELEVKNPADNKWQRRNRMAQLMTEDIGHPHVEKLVANVTMLFRLSDNREQFWRNYARAFPKAGDQTELSLETAD